MTTGLFGDIPGGRRAAWVGGALYSTAAPGALQVAPSASCGPQRCHAARSADPRRVRELSAARQPRRPDHPAADGSPKYVVSDTLTDASSENSTCLAGSALQPPTERPEQIGGSASLRAWLCGPRGSQGNKKVVAAALGLSIIAFSLEVAGGLEVRRWYDPSQFVESVTVERRSLDLPTLQGSRRSIRTSRVG